MEHIINLSDGSSYAAELVVYRDYTESNGQWRLFWLNPGTACGVHEQSRVTGQPFFRTMHKAISYGERKYGIKARYGRRCFWIKANKQRQGNKNNEMVSKR